MSANESLTTKEQHWYPHYLTGLDDLCPYLHPPLPFIYCPDHDHHGHPAATNKFSPNQYNPPLSQMDDGPSSTAEFFDSDQYLFSDLSCNRRDIPEGGSSSLNEGPSPPPPSKPSHDFIDPSLPTEALRSSPASPSFANDQHEYSSRSPHLDQSAELYPQEFPHSPRSNLIPEIGGIADPTQESSSLSNFYVSRPGPGPISEYYAYTEAEGALNSGAAPALIDEESTCFMTSNQVLPGYVNSFAKMLTNGHGSPLPCLVHQNEGAASPNSQSAAQANHPVIVAPSTASNQRAAVDENRSKLRCRRCGASFFQRQALNRHKKDKHRPRNICPFCKSFRWPSGRKYLFRRHLEQRHPEQNTEEVLAYFLATGTPSDH